MKKYEIDKTKNYFSVIFQLILSINTECNTLKEIDGNTIMKIRRDIECDIIRE